MLFLLRQQKKEEKLPPNKEKEVRCVFVVVVVILLCLLNMSVDIFGFIMHVCMMIMYKYVCAYLCFYHRARQWGRERQSLYDFFLFVFISQAFLTFFFNHCSVEIEKEKNTKSVAIWFVVSGLFFVLLNNDLVKILLN